MDQIILPVQDSSFFTAEEISRFGDLAKKHFGRDLTDSQVFDQFHRLFLLVDMITKTTQSGIINKGEI
jgi:hypothetical protein